MAALVAHVEAQPGAGDLEERLIRCFRTLITGGELTGELELREARDRVAAWFEQAGVPAEPTASSWFNSD